MDVAQEIGLDRLDVIRHEMLDEIDRLRCERALAAMRVSDKAILRDMLTDITDQIEDAERILHAIDGASGDVRRITLKPHCREKVA